MNLHGLISFPQPLLNQLISLPPQISQYEAILSVFKI